MSRHRGALRDVAGELVPHGHRRGALLLPEQVDARVADGDEKIVALRPVPARDFLERDHGMSGEGRLAEMRTINGERGDASGSVLHKQQAATSASSPAPNMTKGLSLIGSLHSSLRSVEWLAIEVDRGLVEAVELRST